MLIADADSRATNADEFAGIYRLRLCFCSRSHTADSHLSCLTDYGLKVPTNLQFVVLYM